MAKPTAQTELGGSKVAILADATATTPAATSPVAVEKATSGEATYAVGWAGVATHRQGQALTGAGGFTVAGTGPVVLAAGLDSATVRAIAVDSSGRLIVAGDGTGAGVDVNPIAGQVGAQGNTGAVTATTQRVCLATDVPLPVGTALLGKIALADMSSNVVGVTANRLLVDTGGGGGQSYADDAAFTVASSQVNPVGGILSADTIDSGDVGAVGMTAQREMRVQLGSAGVPVTTGGGVEVAALRVTVASDSTGVLSVDDNSGSLTVDQPTGSNLHTVVDSGTITTVSTVTAVTGITNPVDVTPTSPAANDYLPVRITDGTGFGLKSGGWDSSSVAINVGRTAIDKDGTSTADVTALGVPSSGQRWYVTDLQVSWVTGSSTPAVGTCIIIQHGATGSSTEIARVYVDAAQGVAGHMELNYTMPNLAGSINKEIVCKASASLGTGSKFSVIPHAYSGT